MSMTTLSWIPRLARVKPVSRMTPKERLVERQAIFILTFLSLCLGALLYGFTALICAVV